MSIFFPNCTVKLINRTLTTAPVKTTATGEEIVDEKTPPQAKALRANLQPYSTTTDGGQFRPTPNMLDATLYKLMLDLTTETKAINPGDTLEVVAFDDYPFLVGKKLGVTKGLGRGKLTRHLSLLVQTDARF